MKSKITDEGSGYTIANPEVEREESVTSQPMAYSPVQPSASPAFNSQVFTPQQKAYLNKVIDQKLFEQEAEVGDIMFSELQVEMMRQFMIQRDEIYAMIRQKLKSDLDKYLV